MLEELGVTEDELFVELENDVLPVELEADEDGVAEELCTLLLE